MQPVTVCRACDGPSCRSSQGSETQFPPKSLWRSVVPTTVRSALPSQRSENRSLYQILKSWSVLKRGLTTVRRTCDGSSYRSVTEFRESISVPNFLFSKCYGTRPPRRSVVLMTVRRGVRRFCLFFQNWSLLLKTTKQVVTYPNA